MNRTEENISLEDTYSIFKEIERSGELSQRDFTGKLGYSLGKVNFLLKSLGEKGFVKMENFVKSNNKIGYRYIFTPEGFKEKYIITAAFLKRKEAEFVEIQAEIEELRKEVGD